MKPDKSTKNKRSDIVAVWVTPWLDKGIEPTCWGCPFLQETLVSCHESYFSCDTNGDNTVIKDLKPKPTCPIHNNERNT